MTASSATGRATDGTSARARRSRGRRRSPRRSRSWGVGAHVRLGAAARAPYGGARYRPLVARGRGRRHPRRERLWQVDAAAHRGGLDAPTTGGVRIDGTPVEASIAAARWRSRSPGSCRGGRWRRTWPSASTRHRPRSGTRASRELLELVGLTEFAEHRPREVSGGMAQRTSLARALARNPGVLLLDEPFGALDALTRLRMQDLLLEVHAAAPTTVLLVTHDVEEALQLADRVILLGPEPGREGATIRQVLDVPGERPRDRGSAELAELRAEPARRPGRRPPQVH